MLTGDAHRSFVRSRAACPRCGVDVDEFCRSLETGERTRTNHAERVTAATGQDLSKVDWSAARGRAHLRAQRGSNRRRRPAMRKQTPGGW